jgi:multiple sugar transport system substrate-binding protein
MRRALAIAVCLVLVGSACGTSNGSPAASGPAGTAGGPGGSTGPAFDPAAISGSATLGQWDSSPAEHSALSSALAAFAVTYPNIKVDQTTVSGNYPAQMITRFGAHNPPDIFYVNAEYAQDWIDPGGFLLPLDDYIAKSGFKTDPFFKNYLSIFTGADGHIYGLPKDGNTIALAYNADLVPNPPTTMDELITTAQGLVGKKGLKAPMCLNAALDRGLGFLYAQGGSLLTADNKAEAIDTPQSKQALQWYMDLFKNGLGTTNKALGDGWCGEALGKGDVAMTFEGGWLLGFMQSTYPKVNWKFAEMPTGSSGSKVTLSYTAAYGIGVDSANKDQAWALMQYLTGPQGMAVWTGGGIAVPSRSDVPVPAGFDIIVKGAAYSKPGSGFMKGYNDVQTAFAGAFDAEITNKTYSADPVIAATVAAINKALSQ